MDQEKNRESLLWEYLDGSLSAAENAEVEQMLVKDPVWQKTLAEIREMNDLFKASEMEHPSMRFSANVMDDISKYSIAPATRSYVNNKIIYAIGGFFIVSISVFLIYMFTQADFSSSGTGTSLPVQMPEFSFDWRKIINSTYVQLFLMADVVFGLMLLDRYLAGKRNTQREKSGLV